MFFDEKKIKQRSGNNTIPAGKNHDDDGAGSFEKYFLPDLVIFFKIGSFPQNIFKCLDFCSCGS